jgi:hypothetical protein
MTPRKRLLSWFSKAVLISAFLAGPAARGDKVSFTNNQDVGFAVFFNQLSSCQTEVLAVELFILSGSSGSDSMSSQILGVVDGVADMCSGQLLSTTGAGGEASSATVGGQTQSVCIDLIGNSVPCPSVVLAGRTQKGSASTSLFSLDADGDQTVVGNAQLDVRFTPTGGPLVWDSLSAKQAALFLRQGNSALHQHLANVLDGALKLSDYLSLADVHGTALFNGTDQLARTWDKSLVFIWNEHLSATFDPFAADLDPALYQAANAIQSDIGNAQQAILSSAPWLPGL